MVELIAAAILTISVGGMILILCRKMPQLSELPEALPVHFDWKGIALRIKNRTPLKEFSPEMFLHRMLSRIRILTLKTDHKTSGWLHSLRERAKKKRTAGKDDYWSGVKDSTKEKE
jgi:uncharacterized membrane protein